MTARRWYFKCVDGCGLYVGPAYWAPAGDPSPPACPSCGTPTRRLIETLPGLRASALQKEILIAAANGSLRVRVAKISHAQLEVAGGFTAPHGRSFSDRAINTCLKKGFIRYYGLICDDSSYCMALTRKGYNALPERLQADISAPETLNGEHAEGDYH